MATIKSNTMQPMPIYGSKNEWWTNKRKGDGACRHTIVGEWKMIPFYVSADYVKSSSVTVKMMSAIDGTMKRDITENCTITQVANVGGMKSYYFSFSEFQIRIADGLYYLEIFWGGLRYFWSDIFVVANTSDMMNVTYSHSKQVMLQDGSVAMFDNTTEMPLEMWLRPEGGNVLSDWQTEETVDTRDGFNFVEKRDMWRNHSIVMLANERGVDAMMMMWVCDKIEISYAGDTYSVDYMDAPSVAKTELQNMREVTLTWRTDEVVQVNGTVR